MAMRTLANEGGGNLRAQARNMPRWLELEAAYAPIWDALGMQSWEQGLLGSEESTVDVPWRRRNGEWETQEMQRPGSRGYLDVLQNDISPVMDALSSQSRESFMEDYGRLSPMYRESMDSTNPEMAQLLAMLTEDATTDLEAGASLNPSEARTASQAFRGAVGDRGLDMNMDAFMEALGTTNYGRQLQRERRGFAGDVVNMNQEAYVAPVWRALGVSAPFSAAQGAAGAGSGLVAGNGAQNFDPYSQYAAGLHSQNSQIHAMPYDPNTEGFRNTQFGVNVTGQVIGAALGGMCWVARAVYGAAGRWTLFRRWLVRHGSTELLDLYSRNGEALALWLKNRPAVKALVRGWMDARIAEMG